MPFTCTGKRTHFLYTLRKRYNERKFFQPIFNQTHREIGYGEHVQFGQRETNVEIFLQITQYFLAKCAAVPESEIDGLIQILNKALDF